jgi:catechol 2,3-dioxygenase-like lactoylglutathione lyase family enzyme
MTLHRALQTTVPEAVLYSQQSLSLAVPGVTEVRCADPEAAFRFRYDGLRLVRQAGNQYLFLSATWTREDGVAVLIPRSGSVRLEFAPPGQPRTAC